MRGSIQKFAYNLPKGSLGIALLGGVALVAPFLAPYNPQAVSLMGELSPPSLTHWLGQDLSGRDVLSIVLHGFRSSLASALIATIIAVSAGLIIGSLSGFLRGFPSRFFNFFIDLGLVFPGFLLALTLAALLGQGEFNLALSIALSMWAGYARLVRSEALAIRECDYIIAARAYGAGSIRIVVRHVWPNLGATLAIQSVFGFGAAIMMESSLGFLGLGYRYGTPTWGSLLQNGRDVLLEAPHVAGSGAMAIAITIWVVYRLGEGIRSRLNPGSSPHDR